MINYEILKQSEHELHEQFVKFCEHVFHTWQYIYKKIKTKQLTSVELNEIYRLEDISNHFEIRIQDDCIWSISKNEPLGNHLRYIIAILNSIKDLERMADYGINAMRYFVNNQVPQELYALIVDLLNDALKSLQKVIDAIKSKPAIETYKICQTAHVSFKKHYNEMIEQLSGILKKSSQENIEKMFQGGVIIIKHIERLIDHLVNIVENFVFIKQPDLFFNKQSKQTNK